MKNVLLHPDAERELWHAIDFYESILAGLGLDCEAEIRHAFAAIEEFPETCPQRSYGTRVKLLKRFPFAIYYLEAPEMIWMIALAPTSRKPYYWHKRILKP
jgi:toxin ParE1/3/4